MEITGVTKEVLFMKGFNIVELCFKSGTHDLTMLVYLTKTGEVKGKITCTDKANDTKLQSAEYCCLYGAAMHKSEYEGFFPNLDKNIEFWKKYYPHHFNIFE